jgi:hypothetical protein
MRRQTLEEQKPTVLYRALIEDWEVHHHFDINSIRAEFNDEFSGSFLFLYGRMIEPRLLSHNKPVEISIGEDLSDHLFTSNRELELTGQGYKKRELVGGSIEQKKDSDEYKARFFVPSSYFHRLALSMDALLPALFLGFGRAWERKGAYIYDFDIRAFREGEPGNTKLGPIDDQETKAKSALKKIEILEKELQRIKRSLGFRTNNVITKW